MISSYSYACRERPYGRISMTAFGATVLMVASLFSLAPILSGAANAAAPTTRIDSGSASAPAPGWSTDTGYEGGRIRTYGSTAIGNTDQDRLYQSARSWVGTGSYRVPIAAPGSYVVDLHFFPRTSLAPPASGSLTYWLKAK